MTTKKFTAVFNASPVYYDGKIFQGWLGVEGSGPTRGGLRDPRRVERLHGPPRT